MKRLPPLFGRRVAAALAKGVILGVYLALDREGYPRPLGWILRRNDLDTEN